MATKEEKCEFCGCRGGSTICYYNCGCHKPKDENVLPKKWSQETAVKIIELGGRIPFLMIVCNLFGKLSQM